VPLTPLFGADSVEGNYESYLAAVAVMETVRRYPEPFDAVIQAGYGEHGREGLQELLDVPVVDITEAAASTAMFLGHKYSVVTTLDRAVPLIEDRLKLAGTRGARRSGQAGWRCWNSRRTRTGPSPRSWTRRNKPSAKTRPRSSCSGAAGWPDSMRASAKEGDGRWRARSR
jgi:hypothetical protein